jgi:hypothetical protein
MKANYRKLFLWSSLGSIAVGTVVALTRRPRRSTYAPVACRRIPRGCSGIHLWTERFEMNEGGLRQFVHDRYFLQPTHFRLWSVLDLSFRRTPGRTAPESAAIFHVTQMRSVENSVANQHEEFILDRFYGVITMVDPSNRRACGANMIARGGILEVRKCYVGGTNNGVESGETHRSIGRILNYRIEMPQS